jgi:hypothetical protein|tara:strand:+ start:199 stop:591 length:393 start_codon:yes stop_codon:yes gene_type:complete
MDELKGIQYNTPLSYTFFSANNIKYIQTNLRYQVWLHSNKTHVIGNQSEEELKVIMRSIFLQNSLNQENDIIGQVRDLNALVISYAVKMILTEIKQFVSYNKEISAPRQIMNHSINTSIRGSRQLEQKPW